MGVSKGFTNLDGEYFSAEQRNKGDKDIKAAIADGRLKPFDEITCVFCKQDKGIRHYHCEDYNDSVGSAKGICWRCHLILHSIKRRRKPVLKYFKEIMNGKQYPPVYKNNLGILGKEHGI